MAKSLSEFYNDKETRDNVKNYLIEFLEKQGLKALFSYEDTTAYPVAKEVIEKAFEEMEYLFTPKPKSKEIINPSR